MELSLRHGTSATFILIKPDHLDRGRANDGIFTPKLLENKPIVPVRAFSRFYHGGECNTLVSSYALMRPCATYTELLYTRLTRHDRDVIVKPQCKCAPTSYKDTLTVSTNLNEQTRSRVTVSYTFHLAEAILQKTIKIYHE